MTLPTQASSTVQDAADRYRTDGWCTAPFTFDQESVATLRGRITELGRQDRPEVVHEKGSGTTRAVHGCHNWDELCAALVRLPELVGLAETLLGGPVYVYQFKVNFKQPYEGAAWPWHQDYAFWREEDGMPRPDAVNIAVALDEAHRDNGPLTVVPGSHRLGLLDLPDRARRSGDWRDHVSADLAYTVTSERAARLAAEHGTELVIGPAGVVHAFHPSIVHSSTDNLSPDRRALLLITYNAVANAPAAPTRPEFLVARDTTALRPAADPRLTVRGPRVTA
ncbi:phytanoyl-CoA dioxygenase family protein [Kitasatospora sp. NPDC101801]|uniref:phytanoyl-CoA dioxygenase family protein n=1 Tax=Kitasatospora sp. NPDC101801 TaxID=3364103 RepID=UPI00380D58DB